MSCGTDFSNPLSREWALLCIRNVCADNIENQKFIEELKLQKVVSSEFLEEHGLKVEMNSEGKFKVEKSI